MDKCTKCRKFGAKLFLKGQRCLSPKCSFTRRNYQPGIQGAKGKRIRKSEYGLQLIEKQKAKAEYGLRERQFTKIFRQSAKSKKATGEELLKNLEMRLDNIVYRLGWAASRAQARQLVRHKKIKINNKIVNIPSTVLKLNDNISPVKQENITSIKTTVPKWLKVSNKNLQAEILKIPSRQDIETDLDEQLIIEFYSR